MRIKLLPLKRAVRSALFVLLLNVVGLTNVLAQNSSLGNMNCYSPLTRNREIQNLPYTQSFVTDFGTYTTYDVRGAQSWYINNFASAEMSGYSGGNYANEDWLISSPVALTSVSDAKMTMIYSDRYFDNNLNQDLTIWASSNYIIGSDPKTAMWTQVVVNLNEGNSWSYQSAEIPLTEFVGQTVTFAVKYVSSTSHAGTIEIRSIAIEEGVVESHFITAGCWNLASNWNTGVIPGPEAEVFIDANCQLDIDATVAILNINSTLTIQSGKKLTVNEEIINNGSATDLIILDGGRLVHSTEGVLATMKHTITPYSEGVRDGWHLIASPLVENVDVSEVQNLTMGEYDLYYYDETTVYWINQEYAENDFNVLENGTGYLYGNNCVSIPNEVQIGEGTSIVNDFPFYTYYKYSISESLFLANELENAGLTASPITSLSWFATNSTGYLQSNLSIWMANVSESTLTTTSHNTSDMTLVYTGEMIPEIGWNEFVFNENGFSWDGTSNILVCVQRNNGDWNPKINWQGHECGFACVAYDYRDDTPYDMMTQSYGLSTSSSRANTIFKGYGGNNISFVGELQNGYATVNVPLSYTTGHALQGFNLVGNPFAHNVTSYASENVANGCYVMNEAKDDLIVSEISEENPLKPAEGFFVKATAEGASITFNPGRGSSATQSGTIRVELVENDKLIDRLLVKTTDGQPLEKSSFNEKRTRLFAQGERQELAIVPCEGNEQSVNFKAAKNGQYIISVNVDGMDFSYLHLIDNLTGADVDLLAEPSYTFEAKTSDYASRFLLRFISKDGSSTSSETFAFISNGNIIITNANADATLQIVDVMGRVVINTVVARNVSTSGMSAGVYVLRLINGNDVKTQKIVVE